MGTALANIFTIAAGCSGAALFCLLTLLTFESDAQPKSIKAYNKAINVFCCLILISSLTCIVLYLRYSH
jgi:hypothetical protein